MKRLVEITASCPALSEWLQAASSMERLGGLTNENQLVVTPSGKFVLRIPGDGTSQYLNRSWERHAALATSELGVNAPVLFFDDITGIQLSRFLEGATTMTAEGFKDLDRVGRAAKSLRRVHDSGLSFLNRFELFQMIDKYLDVLNAKRAELPSGFMEALDQSQRVREALGRHALPLVPCHCDPLAENFLDDGAASYVIDWEYAGNNDPMWDLADLSVEAGFGPAQEEALLTSYFEGECPPFERGRVVLYKAMCDLLWTLWGVIQHVNGNSADDFWRYAENRLARCRRLMENSEFPRHLAAVRG